MMDQKTIKEMRRTSREAAIAHANQHGRQRAESWGGKPDNRKTRRDNKLRLKESF